MSDVRDDERCNSTRGEGQGSLGPCLDCGYVRRLLPAWAKNGVVFALDGVSYRIVAAGCSTNGPLPNGRSFHRGRQNAHFRDYVIAEPRGKAVAWSLPQAACALADISSALLGLREMPRFTPEDLERALHLAHDEGASP